MVQRHIERCELEDSFSMVQDKVCKKGKEGNFGSSRFRKGGKLWERRNCMNTGILHNAAKPHFLLGLTVKICSISTSNETGYFHFLEKIIQGDERHATDTRANRDSQKLDERSHRNASMLSSYISMISGQLDESL